MSGLPKPNIARIEKHKPMLNVGCLLDIPNGHWVEGKYGESIMNGGLPHILGINGPGNTFKSTLMNYMVLSAANRISLCMDTNITTLDTESNIHEHRLVNFTQTFENFKGRNILDEGIWNISDKTTHYSDQWFDEVRAYLNEKIKAEAAITLDLPFLDRDGKSLMKAIVPTFSTIDSLTKAISKAAAEMLSGEGKNKDEGARNMFNMRNGLWKSFLFNEIPGMVNKYNHYFAVAAHKGKEQPIAAGPFAPKPEKKLGAMRAGDKIKGVTDDYYFLTQLALETRSVKELINANTKAPEYPRNSEENKDAGSNDLKLVEVVVLRNKAGKSGFTTPVVVSQEEGVLPSLTEFVFLKDFQGRFGIGGNIQNYELDLYPEVKLSRTTVRPKIDEDPKLRRALNITAELCQMHLFNKSLGDLLCTPKELREDLERLGYDWDMILSETRGWYTFNNDKHDIKFLSTLDLLKMRKEQYRPYWLKDK